MITRTSFALGVLLSLEVGPAAAEFSSSNFQWWTTSYATQLSAGAFHTCMINTCGTIQCWGRNHFGQASAPTGLFTQIAAGAYHSCGLRSNGTVVCWGDNQSGQRNVPTTG